MDGKGWPWKRKSSDKEKPVVGNESTNVCSLSYLASLENQEKCRNTNYVQITMDSYTHMSKMEDQVNDLKEKLTLAQSEIMTKESLILQHAKVAEEAVSGWEKADSETLGLKRQLESVMVLKLAAEDRASHLDDALRECTRQIRVVKDECDQKLQATTIQWDKIKAELEGKIDELSQGLHRAGSDNGVLTRSLQERSEMVIRIREERSKAEADVEKLKSKLQLAEKEISSLKYDVHVACKEVEIRNEEKNMSLKSAEIANKQYLEGVKKIAKLEGECQRLRGLLRKKLPGPAAMAQMKLEVESYTDPRAHIGKADVSTDLKLEECKRENVYLTRRRLEMEEEIRTLKEHLAARNNELQVSRNVCVKTLGKLKILEEQMHNNAPKSNSSVTSVSEDGFDEEGSSSECSPVTSTDSHNVSFDGLSKPKSPNRLELMDDFLEIEKLAANDPDGDNSAPKSVGTQSSSSKSSKQDEDTTTLDQLLTVLRSRINRIFESEEGISIEKIVEAARHTIQEMQGSSSLFEFADETLEKLVLSSQEDTENSEIVEKNTRKQDLEISVGDSLLKEVEQLKMEKENIALELSSTKAELEEQEQLTSELRSQLTSSGDLQSLAETQLKCVTESYKSLELQTKDLEAKVKSLEQETERLQIAISTEKQGHEETIAKCRDLMCSSAKLQPNQEKDIASATEKLAACQETIHLLSQQLQSLQPQQPKLLEATPNSSSDDSIYDHIIQPSRSVRHTVNPTVHAIIKSSSVSSSSKEDNEKHTRGLGRFFSSKQKNNGR